MFYLSIFIRVSVANYLASFVFNQLYFNATDPLSELWQIAWIIPAFWCLLSYALLLVICVLWAPSRNPTRYLFFPWPWCGEWCFFMPVTWCFYANIFNLLFEMLLIFFSIEVLIAIAIVASGLHLLIFFFISLQTCTFRWLLDFV